MALDDFYLAQQEPNRSCFLGLRRHLLSSHFGLTETQKYGMPCFCWHNKPLVYLWTDKKSTWPYVLFVEGKKMSHPALVAGDRKKMRHFPIRPEADIPVEELDELIQLAVSLLAK